MFEDADIDRAVDAAIASKFRAAGQTCVCADRFLLHTSIERRFLSKLCQKTRDIRVGRGLEPGTEMGPLISPAAVRSVRQKVDAAVAGGAELLLGGGPPGGGPGPNFYPPTVLRGVDPASGLWREETFGPVVAAVAFRTEDEAVALANDSGAGLAAYFCTKDMERVFRVSGR